jgi:nicotianamine synthase
VLAAFPYFTNYELITQVEASLIRDALPSIRSQPEHIAFIGSGPLPLTSLLLAKTHFPSAKVTNIDSDSQALALSHRLSNHSRLEHRVRTLLADASSVPTEVLKQCDVVYLAALVGMSVREKTAILRSVASKLKGGSILVARSAHGLRRLLYPVLDAQSLDLKEMALEFVTEWVPSNDEIVNSVLVFRKIASACYGGLVQW